MSRVFVFFATADFAVSCQDYNKIAYVLDQPRDARESILKGEQGNAHLSYLISLIDLLSTCAEVMTSCC